MKRLCWLLVRICAAVGVLLLGLDDTQLGATYLATTMAMTGWLVMAR